MFVGIVIGFVIGLVVAAGIAWYLTGNPSPFKTVAPAPQTPLVVPEPGPAPSKSAEDESIVVAPPPPVAPAPQAKTPAPPPTRPVTPQPERPSAPPAKSDFTFFDILPGEQAGKAPRDKLTREVWWLQVAALREAKDADRLKARLTLLGLPVHTQKVASGETTLHRVRVGPFKTEDEALGALDTLSENDFEPRLLKEQVATP